MCARARSLGPADVPGQKGEIPQVGLGTATIKGDKCKEAVKTALAAGYTMLDTALLYGNQEAVGEGANRCALL